MKIGVWCWCLDDAVVTVWCAYCGTLVKTLGMVVSYEYGVCGWKYVVPILPASVPLFYLQTQWRQSSSLVNPRYKGGSASLVSCPACSVLKHGKNFTKNFSLDRVLLDLLFQQLHFSHLHWQYDFCNLKTLIELVPHKLSKSSKFGPCIGMPRHERWD